MVNEVPSVMVKVLRPPMKSAVVDSCSSYLASEPRLPVQVIGYDFVDGDTGGAVGGAAGVAGAHPEVRGLGQRGRDQQRREVEVLVAAEDRGDGLLVGAAEQPGGLRARGAAAQESREVRLHQPRARFVRIERGQRHTGA